MGHPEAPLNPTQANRGLEWGTPFPKFKGYDYNFRQRG
jgi:hypothetical protein